MIALSVLTVLGIIVGSIQYVLQSSHKQFFHAYYNEKALATIDGINAIARGKAQDKLEEIIKAKGAPVELTDEVVQQAQQLRLWDEGGDLEPDAHVSARIAPDKLRYFAKESPYETIREAKSSEAGSLFAQGDEVEGLVEITCNVGFTARRTFGFRVPKRTVVTEYEFKRILRVPQYFRQFALYVKNAGAGDESFDKYAGAVGYNRVGNDIKGYARGGGALFVSPGGNLDGSALPKADGNPFESQTGYVYLGGDKPIYLNLAAGDDDSEFSEEFQLYKGGTTNFYKDWDIDFSSFMEQAKLGTEASGGGGRGGLLSRAWNWVKSKLGAALQQLKKMIEILDALDELETKPGNEQLKTSGLPLYYVVRKDYGYHEECATDPKYKQFGFDGAGEVNSSSLHLYGVKSPQGFQSSGVAGETALGFSGTSMGATLVMGKVYRRCLSLAGYKQRRGDEDPTSGRRFEVQAGPVEYFKDFDTLVKRKHTPVKGGTAVPEAEAPIWVWDGRVDWNRHAAAVNGTWYPISGWGLLGRLLPGMGRFWSSEDKDKVKKLFEASLLPPPEIREVETTEIEEAAKVLSQVRQLQDFPERIKGGVSPLIATLTAHGYFRRVGGGEGPWVDTKGSPYFEELLRNFAYASYLTRDEIDKAMAGGSGSEPPPEEGRAARFSEETIRSALLAGHGLWSALKQDPACAEIPPSALQSAYPPSGDPNRPSKSEFWTHSDDTDPTDKGRYPFSLPDPWANGDGGGSSGTGAGTGAGAGAAAAAPHPQNFQKAFEDAYGSDKDEVFDKYFRPNMTDPGRTQPYNYSIRFMFQELKDLFAKPEEERKRTLLSEVAPEIREGIGFKVKGVNDWLAKTAGDEGVKHDRALDDELLKEIFAKRKSDPYLKKGFYFMDEVAGSAQTPSDAKLGEPWTKGSRWCWHELDEAEFKERFGPQPASGGKPQVLNFGNAVKMKGDLSVFGAAPTMVKGGGVIVVPGRLTIGSSLASDAPLTLVADEVVFTGDIQVVKAMIVAKKVTFETGGFVLEGALACEEWNLKESAPSGRILLAYDSRLKKEASCVQVIEPRIHRMTIASGGDD